jgi:signal transduction histidine kinase
VKGEVARAQEIEAGVLPLFRILVTLELLLLLMRVCVNALHPESAPAPSPWPAIASWLLLLGYLSYAHVQQRLGRIYLPLALAVTTAGPLLGSAGSMRLRLAAGVSGDDLTRGSWTLVVALLVPIVLIAWQYGFRWVVWTSVAMGAADLGMSAPLSARGGPPALTLAAIAVVRCLFFLPVGYAVSRLVDAQRRQRERHAATLEQLAVSRERNRLARELHDTLAHGLSAVAVQLEAMNALWEFRPEEARARLGGALDTTRTALHEARRAIGALRASPLEDLGLATALRDLAVATAARASLELDVRVPAQLDGLAPDTEQGIYRIAAEALANVARHAEARRIEVHVETQGSCVRLVVRDDGRGFDPAAAENARGFGRQGMCERAQAIGADLQVESAPGQGTAVRLAVRRSDDTRPDL